MTATRLLKLFNRVADAPGAMRRLRNLVLQLAVRGRLSVQSPEDEPARELLLRLSTPAGRAQRVSRSGASGATSPRRPFSVPPNWAWARFGDITTSRDGERIPVSKEERSGRAKLFDYYGASGVIDKIDGFIFDKPLLLIGEDGANLVNRSSPIAFMARGKYWVNNHAHVIDGFSESFLRYLEEFINSTDLAPYVTGTAQPKMNQAKMNSIPVAVPPEPEQRRIVAKVDELMALCDRLEAAQKEREAARQAVTASALTRIKSSDTAERSPAGAQLFRGIRSVAAVPDLRATIFELAVRGRLTAQIERDTCELPDARLTAPKKIQLFDLPSNWRWVRVADAADSRLGKMLDKNKNKGEPHPYLRNVNVRWFGFDLSNLLLMPFEQTELEEFALRRGDVLVCEGGEPGRAAVWDGQMADVYFQKALHRLRFTADTMPEYFVIALKASALHGRLRPYFTGTGIQHLTGRSLNGYLFPCPPLAEQRLIVAKVKELMALCDQLEAHLKAGDIARSRLLDALIAETLAEPQAQSA